MGIMGEGEGALDLSDLARSDGGVGFGEDLAFGALVIVRAVVLVSVAVVRAEGVTAVAFYSGETKLLFAVGRGALVALLAEETAIFTKGRGRSAGRDARRINIHHRRSICGGRQ